MKQLWLKLLFCLGMVGILFVIGCASNKKQETKEVDYLLCNDTSRDDMAEIESGFFYIFDERLYYADKEDMTKWVPVCNKADCNHHDEVDCNAYVGSEIAQKGEKIYFVSNQSVENGLIKKEPLCVREVLVDGSGSKKVYQIPFEENIDIRSYRALISSSSLILSYSYLTENGMYQNNLARLEEDGTLYKMYSEQTEGQSGGLIFSSSVYRVTGIEGIVSYDLTSKYTDKTGIDCQNVLWRMDKREPEMIPIPEDVSFGWSYIADDYMIDYENRDGYEKGYYKYDFTTGEKTLLGKAEQENALGYIMTENCVLEGNRYLGQTPENPYLKIYYNDEWKYIELPEVIAKASKETSFLPISIASDRIFFAQEGDGSDGYGCRLYYVMLADDTPELTYCTTFGSDDSFNLSNIEQSKEEFNTEWKELDITVFDTEKFLLKITGVGFVPKETQYGHDEYRITMYCENKKSEEDLYLSLQDGAINGLYAWIPQNIHLKSGETSKEHVIDIINERYGEFYDFDTYDFDEYTDISFYIYDINDKTTQKVVHVYVQGEENAITYVRESQPTDEVLIDNEYVTVTIVGYETNTIENDTVNLFIKNKSDTNIRWYREGFPKINGVEANQNKVSGGMDKILPPGYCAYESLELPSEFLEENEVASIENWDVTLKFWYGETWDNELVNETFTITPPTL